MFKTAIIAIAALTVTNTSAVAQTTNLKPARIIVDNRSICMAQHKKNIARDEKIATELRAQGRTVTVVVVRPGSVIGDSGVKLNAGDTSAFGFDC